MLKAENTYKGHAIKQTKTSLLRYKRIGKNKEYMKMVVDSVRLNQ
jgi:hypothetical protein